MSTTSNPKSLQLAVSAVRSRLRSTDGVSHKSLLTAAIHPASKLSFSALDHCSDSHLLCVSAVNPDWVDIWLTNFPPFQIDIRLFHNLFLVSIPHVSSLIASPLSNVSCPILAWHSSVCCPIPTQPGHPAVRPYLSRMFCRTYSLFARLPLANSSVCWIVGPCGVLFAVVFHGQPTHRFKNCKSQALSPSRRLTQRVFIAPIGVNSRNSSVRSSLPTKTPYIRFIFDVAPSSERYRPMHTSPNGTTSPVQSLHRIERYGVLPRPFT